MILDPASSTRVRSLDDYARELEHANRERRALEARIACLEAELDAARQRALHDLVTGVPNRMLFLERLEHGLRQARRHGWLLAVLFIDLDDFKRVNDTHGHEAGDETLIAVARTLQGAVRAEDTVCRYGGDEFACLLLNVHSPEQVVRFAVSLEARLARACRACQNATPVNASIGVALHPEHGDSADALLRHADAAMYRAKGTETRVVCAGAA